MDFSQSNVYFDTNANKTDCSTGYTVVDFVLTVDETLEIKFPGYWMCVSSIEQTDLNVKSHPESSNLLSYSFSAAQ